MLFEGYLWSHRDDFQRQGHVLRVIHSIISTKRSGHHAFIDWMTHHRASPLPHLNDRRLDRLIRCDLPAFAESGQAETLVNFEGVTFQGYDRVCGAARGMGLQVEEVVFLRHPLNMLSSLIHREIRNEGLTVFSAQRLIRQMRAQTRWTRARPSGQRRFTSVTIIG